MFLSFSLSLFPSLSLSVTLSAGYADIHQMLHHQKDIFGLIYSVRRISSSLLPLSVNTTSLNRVPLSLPLSSEQNSENLLRMNLKIFKQIISNHFFRSMPLILFLNKKDVLAEKIQTSHLQTYFPEFTGKQGDAEAAMDFIRGLFLSIVIAEGRLVCVHFTCALDPGNIRQVFCDVKDNVLACELSFSSDI
ncbi:guanine nucleotide-binding protein G(q) subunit alpha-like isoform X2 [Conger conger]|uniref:guanine nucleotide-binding protein G(q) subunit alpha-like isoform X2 n=1 Tax=Conger conger TaxID=82655 RepID=UPI002A5AFACF|nr:guanine nucleotide-binding protein G(q) subunit alpha-like isoform X2 [Conger conger]